MLRQDHVTIRGYEMTLSDRFYKSVCSGAVVIGTVIAGVAMHREIDGDRQIAARTPEQAMADHLACDRDRDCLGNMTREYQTLAAAQGLGGALAAGGLAMLGAGVGNGRRLRSSADEKENAADGVRVNPTGAEPGPASRPQSCSSTNGQLSSGPHHPAQV